MDVDVDRARLPGVVVAPYPFEKLLSAEDLAGIANEEGEQLERLRLDRQRLAVAQDLVAGQVDVDRPEIDPRWLADSLLAGISVRRRRARMRAWSSRRLNGLVT